jgi:phosphoserine phosphatase RsbU/P
VARIDLKNGRMEICNAGHTQPWIISQVGPIEKITMLGGVPLGIFESSRYTSDVVEVNPGDTIVLVTDGITEAADKDYRLYGESNLIRFLDNLDKKSFSVIPRKLAEDVRNFTGDAEQSDDMAILVMKYLGKKTEVAETKGDIVSGSDHRKLVIRNYIPEIGRLAEQIDKLVEEWNLPGNTGTQLHLALEELVSNIIFYAYNDKEEHEIRLEFIHCEGGIEIVVEDDGRPFNILMHEDLPDITAAAGERKIGGLGIHFIREITDDVRYERTENKNRVKLIKYY